jgi:hypothetical protein
MQHYPMTKEQRGFLDQDLATIAAKLGDVATLLSACYGDDDLPVRRSEEAGAAVQRLLWALERQAQPDGGSVFCLAKP